MKGQAVHSGEQHQRKEARRKEAFMPKTNYQEEIDEDDPRVAQAIIYLSEPRPTEGDGTGDEPSARRSVASSLTRSRTSG